MSGQDLIHNIRDFAAREIAPEAARIDRERAFPDGWWRKLGEFGLTGLAVPSALGGLQADTGTMLAALEAVGAADGSTAWALLAHTAVVAAIAALGTDAQKQRYLPALARAELLGGTLAGTETGGGSNPGSIKTFARVEGGDYVLDGSKFFMTQAGAGDVFLVLARTDRTPGPQSLSCFIVEQGDAGLTFGEREATMGLHGVQLREMFFDGCRIPASRLLGQTGGAMAVLGAASTVLVLGSSAAALGMAQAAFDATVSHLRSRTVLGTPLAENPAIQARMARILQELTGARAWLEHAQGQLVRGIKGPPVPLWLAKAAITEAAERVVSQCLGQHGAVGYSQALPLERMHRDVRAFAIHWGNSDVFMDMAGKALLASPA